MRSLVTVSASALLSSVLRRPIRRPKARAGSPMSQIRPRLILPHRLPTPLAPPSASSTPTATAAAANVVQGIVEHAGNASDRSSDTSVPPSTSQRDADLVWNADSGATSHMTPHRHWLHNYTPHHIPITLANNNVVYFAGVGSVVFHPKLKGKVARGLSLLVSCMYLTSTTISSQSFT